MCNPITYSDVERYQRVSRNLALSEGEIYTAKYSAKHFDEATTGDIRSIKEFMNECTGSVDRAIDYAIPCLEFVERHNDDKELVFGKEEKVNVINKLIKQNGDVIGGVALFGEKINSEEMNYILEITSLFFEKYLD